MTDSALLVQKNDHVLRITLNRPFTGNVIDLQMAQELVSACRNINADDDIHVVVVTGAGGSFCKGNELEQPGYSGKTAKHYSVASAIADVEKPVIAAINGDCLGQGLELALACDVRVAVADSHFGFPDGARGIIPIDGGTQRLSRIVGKGKALELVLTAEVINAAEAENIGLVSKVVAVGALLQEVESIVKPMANKAPVALRYIKEAVNKGLDLTLEQGLRLEADLYFLLHTTSDRTEGITSFLQKKTPEFKGK
jgi:enoyl-CoA hydratase/carnithine racemase